MMKGGTMGLLSDLSAWLLNRYRIRLLIRAAGRFGEIMKYSMVRPDRTYPFHIVSAQRNMGDITLRCLQSVYDQEYPRDLVRHVFIDDASTDDTPSLIEGWLRHHPDHRVEFIRNSARRGMLANNLAGFRMADATAIGIELNGDDWLPDPGVLKFLNKVYNDDDVWMTYNTLRQTDGTIVFQLPPSRSLLRRYGHRNAPWSTSHLRTFRLPLHRLIPEQHLIDPTTGKHWDLAPDLAVYLAMLELAGEHARHVYRITCAYHPHAMSEHVRDRSGQLAAEARIRALPTLRAQSTIGQG
jgi:hypothetical protein